MQFLVITKQTGPPPPEMVVPLIEAMQAWVAEGRASGTNKSSWSFAGMPGGSGFIEVDSHEELDEIMIRFPFAPFSSIEIIALADIDKALEGVKATYQKMMEMMGSK